MLRVGLTGGIGSGKSTVAELFARHGVPVIDTDAIARELVRPGTPALDEIVREFGEEVIGAGGELDRARLRTRIFENAAGRQRLETILHPRIRATVLRRLSELNAPYCLIVVPLLVETRFDELIDRVLVVDAEEQQQLQRTSRRDQVPPDAIRKIIAAQAGRAERLARADDVIANSGTIEDLEREVEYRHRQYLALARAS